jgi:hypothetical protein
MRLLRFYAPIFFSFCALLVSLLSFYRSRSRSSDEELAFTKRILTNVRSCIQFNASIPQKEEISKVLDEVENKFQTVQVGSDDLRVRFVQSQGCIEHALACFQALGEIDELIGVIHTPTPATPLCMRPDGNPNDLLDPSIRFDLAKLLTVRSRAQIVREYLIKGGKLYVVYPQGGLEKRTAEQQFIYKEALQRFAGGLYDWVLNTNKIDDDMVGATYLFRNPERQVFAFSIKSKQANDIHAQSEWGIWFGPVVEKNVAQRINEVFDYLSEKGGPDVRKEIHL